MPFRPQITALRSLFKLSMIITLSGFIASCSTTEDTSISRALTFEELVATAITITIADADDILLKNVNTIVSPETTNDDNIITPPSITVTGLTNACPALPCASAGGTIATLTIEEDLDNFTIETQTASIFIPDADGAQSSEISLEQTITITNADSTPITYAITIQYLSTSVTDIIAIAAAAAEASPADDDNLFSFLISASFANQPLAISLSDAGDTILLSGTNANAGINAGSITATANLPNGYAVFMATDDDPPYSFPYNFDDPDAAVITELPEDQKLNDLIIAEHDASTNIINGNQSNYAVFLSLDGLTRFSPSHISPSSTDVSFDLDDVNNSIVISATNACAAPPCADAETDLGTLTINEVASTFSITDVQEIIVNTISLNNNTITITVPDQAGATNSSVLLGSVTISNLSDTAAITYNVSVDYSGTPVADIIVTILDGNDNNISNIIAASFNGFDLTPSLSGTTIALSGATNTDITDATGTIAITPPPLPPSLQAISIFMATTGDPPYSSSYSFNDPDGSELDDRHRH